MSTPSASHPQVTYVYRLFSESDELLYVGITKDTKIRFAQHAKDKSWWPEIATSRITQFRSLALALAEESTAILWEKPKYNLAIPSLSRHDTLQDRAARDPFASLSVTQRLAIAEGVTKDLMIARSEIESLQAVNKRTESDLQFEREAGLRARADVAKLTSALRQQERNITSLSQDLANAERQAQSAKDAALLAADQLTKLRAELDQASAALSEASRPRRPIFARRKVDAMVAA